MTWSKVLGLIWLEPRRLVLLVVLASGSGLIGSPETREAAKKVTEAELEFKQYPSVFGSHSRCRRVSAEGAGVY